MNKTNNNAPHVNADKDNVNANSINNNETNNNEFEFDFAMCHGSYFYCRY
jgi:hypothetical protein